MITTRYQCDLCSEEVGGNTTRVGWRLKFRSMFAGQPKKFDVCHITDRSASEAVICKECFDTIKQN